METQTEPRRVDLSERVAEALERLQRRERLYPTGDKEIPEYVKGHDSFCADAATLARDYPRLASELATLRQQVQTLREALGGLLKAWRYVGGDEQVPESLNDDAIWDAATAALRASDPDLFPALSATAPEGE